MMSPPVCQNGGTCYNSYGSFVCRCPPEWTGPTCIEGILNFFFKSLFMVEIKVYSPVILIKDNTKIGTDGTSQSLNLNLLQA